MTTDSPSRVALRSRPAAESIGMNEKDFRALLRSGEIEFYTTPGGHFRIPVWALEAYTRRRVEEEAARRR